MNTVLTISPTLQSGEREFHVGEAVAYGTVSADGETYALTSAPTQADYDAVASVLDTMSAGALRARIDS